MNQPISTVMQQMGVAARNASRALAVASTATKSKALVTIAETLDTERENIKAANAADLAGAQDNNVDQPLVDRLLLGDKGIDQMIEGLMQIDALKDPIGEVTDLCYRPTGIQIGKMRVPLGVIGMIYESRPNVTVDAAALCLKAGNACILRGGSEAFLSNQAIAACVTKGVVAAGLPEACVQLVTTTDRSAVGEMLQLDEFVDVIVPRGGKGLIERVSRETRIPVIKHLDGICHVYIDADADVQKGIDLAFNSKAEKYAVCNAMETLLVHQQIAPEVLPSLVEKFATAQVELRGCEHTVALAGVGPATEADWSEEYLAPILSIKIVDELEAAIEHINRYGSGHTDVIVTENYSRSRQFIQAVDSASVMVNASSQFADGFEYGLGAEVGISTDKLHARGPVGLEGLTSQKYVVYGDGEVRNR
ncbi:MAG: glutamate-5-semialdehyde dehydrogenase [Gammaproteobacteria bacterium]|jgi:glutamate-5-semialdehyde dehydrogenase|nr:glutamate-5-semialdehyde dehydrogenase [Gammaproteobacteria bacterium]